MPGRGRRIPLSTYRLQFHGGFGLDAARAVVSYLDDLGVGDLYASPLTAARPGSRHGYDVIDPTRLNPEVGSERQLAALSAALRRRRMGLLLDIVPNHMAAATGNPWWRELLARGSRSPAAAFFDLDPDPPSSTGGTRVVLPVLGRSCRECLAAGDLRVALEGSELELRYDGLRLPIDVLTWDGVIAPVLRRFPGGTPRSLRALRRLDRALGRPAERPASCRAGETAAWSAAAEEEIRAALAAAVNRVPRFRRALAERIEAINGGGNGRGRRESLAGLLSRQNYRLIHWREAGRRVNYRRFFTINDLACLRMEDPVVFDAWHPLVLRLARAGLIQGLRIDHVDGLREPGLYLRRLRAACDRPLFIVVEKILVGDERVPSRWPVAGTTGYDFLNQVNGLFVDPAGAAALRRIYTRFTADRRRFEDLVYRAKRRLLATDFRRQKDRLGAMLLQVIGRSAGRGPSRRQLRRALEVTTACLPVYRTYIEDGGPSPFDRAVVRAALGEAGRRAGRLPSAAFAAVGRALLRSRGRSASGRGDDARRAFIMRWQQLTGPLMAKGHEDTALYIDHHLISLNDVGGCPDARPLSGAAFHRAMLERRRRSPATMNATSTHDTKRGEDVRVRIDVLSEIPEEWSARLHEWHRLNRAARTGLRGGEVPTPSEEVLIYQTLLGAWPAGRAVPRRFADRVKSYLIKASREAGERTSWSDPDERHEAALTRFVDVILDPSASRRFLAGFRDLQRTVARAGAINGLSQVVIKTTAPGVPDFYQGTELWDLSLVDPDNRRPVDFGRRRSLLARLRDDASRDRAALLRRLVTDPLDPRIKLYTTWRALQLRRWSPALFRNGRYLPIETAGLGRERICAFARRSGPTWAIAVAPRFCAARIARGLTLLGEPAWRGGALRLPAGAPRIWRNVLSGETVRAERRAGDPTLSLARILNAFPVALLAAGPGRRRG